MEMPLIAVSWFSLSDLAWPILKVRSLIKGLDYASTIIDTSYSANAPLSAASSSQIMPLPPDLEPTPHYEANNSANDEDDDAYMQYSRTQVRNLKT